jgi:hypothetical protein
MAKKSAGWVIHSAIVVGENGIKTQSGFITAILKVGAQGITALAREGNVLRIERDAPDGRQLLEVPLQCVTIEYRWSDG